MPLAMTRSIQLEFDIDGRPPSTYESPSRRRPLPPARRTTPSLARQASRVTECRVCSGPLVVGEGQRTCVICGARHGP